MEFKNNLSIYLQIADSIRDDILGGVYPIGSKLPSVRQMAAQLGVNPNTVMRSYAHLQSVGYIINRRGVGFYVSDDATRKIKSKLRQEFVDIELPKILKKMEVLGIDRQLLIDGIESQEKL